MGEDLRVDASSVASRYLPLLGDAAVVMHGPATEEAGLSGSDVDIFVRGIDLTWPLRLPPRSRLTQELRYDFSSWYWVIEEPRGFVALDTTDDRWGLGRDTVRTSEVLDRIVEDDVATFRAAYLAIKRVRKGDARPSEWQRIGRLARADPGGFERALRLEVGDTITRELLPWAVDGIPPPAEVARRINRLRYLRRFGSLPRVAMALRSAAHRYSQRLLHPSGFVVLLVGPDGTGKSTLAARIPDSCGAMFKRNGHVHWRPGILPRPGAMVGRGSSDPSQPHARRPFGPIASLVLLGYYWADFALGDLVMLRHMRIRSGLIVQERGWWDIAVDPERYRLDVAPGIVRALGALLRTPDLTVVMEAAGEVLHARKPELDVAELDRQRAAWHRVLPSSARRVVVDVTESEEDVAAAVSRTVVTTMERRAVRRLAAGWTRVGNRWWIPRGPRRVSRGSFSIYQPPTPGRAAVWDVARLFAGWGGLRLVPRSEAPPRRVRTAIAAHVPARGSYAVSPANHEGRFVVNLLDRAGASVGFAKVATRSDDAEVLAVEADAIERFAPLLPPPLEAPKILTRGPGLLILSPIVWTPRSRPWVLPPDVASALGTFSKTARHGDVAPWNLLRTAYSWVLLDWESAVEVPGGFHDLCHHTAVTFALLGTPDGSAVVAGFRDLSGPVGEAVEAFADGAGLDPAEALPALRSYLREATPLGDRTVSERRGAERLRSLRRLVEV